MHNNIFLVLFLFCLCVVILFYSIFSFREGRSTCSHLLVWISYRKKYGASLFFFSGKAAGWEDRKASGRFVFLGNTFLLVVCNDLG